MPQFDVLTFFIQVSYATVFFFCFYISYTRYFLREIFYSIRFRQKLLQFHSKLKVAIKPGLLFTELYKITVR